MIKYKKIFKEEGEVKATYLVKTEGYVVEMDRHGDDSEIVDSKEFIPDIQKEIDNDWKHMDPVKGIAEYIRGDRGLGSILSIKAPQAIVNENSPIRYQRTFILNWTIECSSELSQDEQKAVIDYIEGQKKTLNT